MSERYTPSPDQVALAVSLRESLASLLPLARLRESDEEAPATWRALLDLGVFGVTVPEELGGSGLGLADEALIVIELGRRVVAPSILSTVGATQVRRANEPSHVAGVSRVASGYRRGDRVVFVGDSFAEQLLVRSASGAQLVAMPSASRVVDDKLWACRLLEAPRLVEVLAELNPAQALRLRLLDAAALAGLAYAALEMAVAYAALREQFGRPIGSFQAVKHHCTNMALAARLAADQVSFAAVALDDGRSDAALQIESAFYVAASAALENAGKNIQVHGGIGFSDEADPQRVLKRARVLIEIAGGLEAALARVAAAPPHEEGS